MEGDVASLVVPETFIISIHALRMEGDFWSAYQSACFDISIHALRMEGDESIREY